MSTSGEGSDRIGEKDVLMVKTSANSLYVISPSFALTSPSKPYTLFMSADFSLILGGSREDTICFVIASSDEESIRV